MSSPTYINGSDATQLSSLESPDYLVLGGGTSGCVIASRLARAGHSVILVEAGKDYRDNPLAFVPAGNQVLAQSEASWAYPANPVLSRHKKDGPREGYLQGKIIGGSTLLNYQLWYRGCKDDYDSISKVLGDEKWSWDNVAERFKHIEEFTPDSPEGMQHLCNYDARYHGPEKGLVRTSFNSEWSPLGKEFNEACVDLGHSIPDDVNGGSPIGISASQWTVSEGARTSAGQSYLAAEVIKGTKLVIMTESLVERVLIEDGVAKGAQLRMSGGDTLNIMAKREVIVSCGAIGSPALLQRSGVGPVAILSKAGVPLVADIPGVGAHLHDHPILPICIEVQDHLPSLNSLKKPEVMAAAQEEYGKTKKGPLAYCAAGGICFSKLDKLGDSKEYTSLDTSTKAAILGNERYHTALLHGAYGATGTRQTPDEGLFHTLWAFLFNLQSEGSVEIVSPDAAQFPTLNLNYYSEPIDRRIAIEGVREALKIACSPTYYNKDGSPKYWKEYLCAPKGAKLSPYFDPGTLDDETIWEFVLEQTVLGPHPHGTCKMSNDKADKEGVVDSQFHVRQVKNLRVADTSVIPINLNAFLQAAAYLIGELASDAILQDHRSSNAQAVLA